MSEAKEMSKTQPTTLESLFKIFPAAFQEIVSTADFKELEEFIETSLEYKLLFDPKGTLEHTLHENLRDTAHDILIDWVSSRLSVELASLEFWKVFESRLSHKKSS